MMEQNPRELGSRSVLGWGNRGWLEIIDLVLTVCDQGTLKTHVMYKCNLNSKQVQQYLDFVTSRGLIEVIQDPVDPKRTFYKTTDKGRKFMRSYNELAEIFSIHEEALEP
jgi:predicted transcriptional regulator